MNRRGAPQSAAGAQLFPFVAVLICTMGALVMLLFAFARHGQLRAMEAARAQPAENSLKDAEVELAGHQWRISQLQQSRDKTESQLAEARLRLSHVEDHLRRLRAESQRLTAAAREMERLGQSTAEQRAADAAALADIHSKIRQARQRLTEAQREAQNQSESYAIVPYEGPNQTRRRPIYIECREDMIILQPEGITLTESDFDGPLGPGNPLASAMRAQREYLMAAASEGSTTIEPYPLLLVRPDGVMAYYAARASLVSWGSEFGYELIGHDWNLEFPPADPQLAEITRRTIGEARVRQRQLVLSAPRSYGRNAGKVSFRSTPTRGGFVEDKRPGGRGGSGGNDGPEFPFAVRGSETQRTGTPAARGFAGATNAGNNGGSPSQSGGSPSGGSQESKSSGQQQSNGGSQSAESIAKKRGRDWGLPDASQSAVSITRPVYLECRPDRLVILPEDGAGGGKEIPLGIKTQDSVEDLVSSVWQHMKSWGIAGKGLYWRPTLLMDVVPGAEARYAELESLLADSGLEVKRRQKSVAATPSQMPRK